MKQLPHSTALIAALLSVVLLAACAGASSTNTPTSSTLTPDGVIGRSRQAAAQVTAVRYVEDSSVTPGIAEPIANHVDGIVVGSAVERHYTTVDGRSVVSVLMGGQGYTRVDNGPWTRQVQAWSGATSPASYLAPAIYDSAFQPDTAIDGVPVYHIRGTADPATPSGPQNDQGTIDVYIRKSDFLLVRCDTTRLLFNSEAGLDNPPVLQTTMTFTDFNAALPIATPDVPHSMPAP